MLSPSTLAQGLSMIFSSIIWMRPNFIIKKGKWRISFRKLETYGQFHQHFTFVSFISKFCAQLSCTYISGLYFFSVRICAQKLHLECWWNWHLNFIKILLAAFAPVGLCQTYWCTVQCVQHRIWASFLVGCTGLHFVGETEWRWSMTAGAEE